MQPAMHFLLHCKLQASGVRRYILPCNLQRKQEKMHRVTRPYIII